MLTTSPPANTTHHPWTALRAFWRAGVVVAVGDVVQLTRAEAAELLAANKIAAAPALPAETTQNAPAPAAAAPARKRAARAKD